VVGVEQWAEIRRLYFVKRLSIKEIARRTGHGRNTIRRALRSGEAPRYRRPPRPSKLDPVLDWIHRLLREDPRLPGKRIRELLEEQGYAGGKTILDHYLRERGRCFCRGRAPSGAPRTGRGCCASSISGSRRGRFRSAAGRRGAATSSSRVCVVPPEVAGIDNVSDPGCGAIPFAPPHGRRCLPPNARASRKWPRARPR
jgi:transposase